MPDAKRSALAMIRSDALRIAFELRDAFPLFHQLLKDIIQVVAVLDASEVQRQLRWRLRSRTKPTARTCLHEDIASGTVIAVAPAFLKEEIQKYLPQIADDTHVTIETAMAEWEDLQRLIRFYTPNEHGAEFDSVDPKDSPYAQTAKELGADFVRTADQHFRRMGIAAADSDIDLTLRDYARSASVLVAIRLGTGLVLVGGGQAVIEIIRGLAGMIRRLPPAVKLTLGVGLAVALLHPSSREKIIQLVKKAWERAKESKPVVALTSESTIEHIAEAFSTVGAAGEAIRSRFPARVREKQTALSHARQVCLKSQRPLTVEEIARRILVNGYTSRSKTFSAYVRRLMRKDPSFVVDGDGLWTFGVAM